MSVSNLKEFPLEEISINMINTIKFAVLIMGLIKFFLLQILLHRKRISSFISAFQTPIIDESTTNVARMEKKRVDDDDDDDDDDEIEVEMVLKSLGISCQEKQQLPAAQISDIFEEREPSLDEVRQAFDVFDDNRDGFIDENEVQRVLSALGFKQGLQIHNCRRMIAAFDEDGDGRIDFHEFVKFMEISFT